MTLKDLSQRTGHFLDKTGDWLDRVARHLRPPQRGEAALAVKARQEGGEDLTERTWMTPPVDIFEGDSELVIMADVPGADRRTVEVTFDGAHELAFRARTHSSGGLPGADWQRAFTLPGAYDAANARASVSRGVLRIEVPRATGALPKLIAVRAA